MGFFSSWLTSAAKLSVASIRWRSASAHVRQDAGEHADFVAPFGQAGDTVTCRARPSRTRTAARAKAAGAGARWCAPGTARADRRPAARPSAPAPRRSRSARTARVMSRAFSVANTAAAVAHRHGGGDHEGPIGRVAVGGDCVARSYAPIPALRPRRWRRRRRGSIEASSGSVRRLRCRPLPCQGSAQHGAASPLPTGSTQAIVAPRVHRETVEQTSAPWASSGACGRRSGLA
jgi:hypothetical protein